jgi:hypothetical protein
MKNNYEPLGSNPFAGLMKPDPDRNSEIVQGKVVNGRGEEMVQHYGEWYTVTEWEKEVQGRHAYLAECKAQRQAIRDEAQRQRDISDASYAAYQARGDQGYADYSTSDENRRLEVGYQRKGTVKDDGIPGGGLMALLFLALVGGGAVVAAIASFMP